LKYDATDFIQRFFGLASSDSVQGFDESLTGEFYEAPRMGLPGIIA